MQGDCLRMQLERIPPGSSFVFCHANFRITIRSFFFLITVIGNFDHQFQRDKHKIIHKSREIIKHPNLVHQPFNRNFAKYTKSLTSIQCKDQINISICLDYKMNSVFDIEKDRTVNLIVDPQFRSQQGREGETIQYSRTCGSELFYFFLFWILMWHEVVDFLFISFISTKNFL